MPPRVHASASTSTSAADAGAGSNGENVVSPFTSHWTCPGSSSLPAGNVVPRITRETWRASVSSLPTPFITDATAPSAKACAVAASADVRVHRLGRDDAEVTRRQRGGVARRTKAGVDAAGAREREPVALDRVDVSLVEVERPHLDVVEGRQVGGEQRADGAAADNADSHGEDSSGVGGRERRR